MGKEWRYFDELTWIGLEARGTGRKVWTWTDGTKVDYLAWVVGAPDAPESQRCVMVRFS
ncbi:unnamed protein product [Cylicostephanus goldi]|uniref:C-type lectin domain-containing protein n=1 Tax=Cylicostephanus goldi TaxID=71465 RepID=A0A3P7PT53_CYLGO|nr:unnamed protein product [Cylicostephanus goldi]